MRPTLKAILVAGTLALGGLEMGATSARAQAIGGGAYRGNYPSYYYSPSGYSGGYYFSPGYYPNPGSAVGSIGRSYFGSSTVAGGYRSPNTYYDESTGRTNLPIPLSKPWLRPLR
jgi:hypothetical protein